MKRSTLVLAVAVLLVSACGAKAPSVAVSSPAPAAPATAASGGVLNCRLPVAGYAISLSKQESQGGAAPPSQKGTGGFLDLPSGKFTPVKESDQSYLASAGVWLPVPMQAVSPDQLSYVDARAPQFSATAPTTTLYMVQVATKAERKLFTPADGQAAYVLAYTARGVYVEVASSTGPGQMDLVLIDPATGSHQSVPHSQAPGGAIQQVFMAISGDFAWGALVEGSQSQLSFKLVRLNLTDGSVVDWYDAPGSFVIVGFDSNGHPIVGVLGGLTTMPGADLFLISAANHAVAIQPQGGGYAFGRGAALLDGHGTWFGSSDGSIWLYSSTKGLTKVAAVPPQPGGNGQPYDEHLGRIVAGPCT
jgi:hypothetical protein